MKNKKSTTKCSFVVCKVVELMGKYLCLQLYSGQPVINNQIRMLCPYKYPLFEAKTNSKSFKYTSKILEVNIVNRSNLLINSRGRCLYSYKELNGANIIKNR